jgi:hypothetical protein
MISGDFNIDLLKFGSHSETDEFMNILGTHFFQPHILQPTRITNHSATLIDNIFFNFLDHFAISGNIINDISDHMANFLIINKFSSLPDNVKIYNRDYSKLDQSALINTRSPESRLGRSFFKCICFQSLNIFLLFLY